MCLLFATELPDVGTPSPTAHSSDMHRPLVFGLIVVLLACVAVAAAAVPRKPVWPRQFDVQFGLSVVESPINPPIVNATSHFYYDFNVQASLITYPDLCLPGLIPVPPHSIELFNYLV